MPRPAVPRCAYAHPGQKPPPATLYALEVKRFACSHLCSGGALEGSPAALEASTAHRLLEALEGSHVDLEASTAHLLLEALEGSLAALGMPVSHFLLEAQEASRAALRLSEVRAAPLADLKVSDSHGLSGALVVSAALGLYAPSLRAVARAKQGALSSLRLDPSQVKRARVGS